MPRSALRDLAFPALTLAGVSLLASAPFDFVLTFDQSPLTQQSATWPYRLSGVFGLVAAFVLVVAVAALAGQRGQDGRFVGRTALVVALLAATCDVYLQVMHLFVLPWLARSAPAVADANPTGSAAVATGGALVLFVVGTVWLAVSAARVKVFGWPASGLLILGAVGFLAGGFSTLALGAGLTWAGAAGLRAPTAIPVGVG